MIPLQPDPDILRTRDSVLTNLLYYVAQSEKINSDIILLGGGALHFIYSSPRYSSDLDFVSPNIRAKKDCIISELTEGFKDKIGALSLNKIIEKYVPRLAKGDEDCIRVSYSQNIPQTPNAKIEIVEEDAFEYAPAVGKFHPVLVESPGEIYADKIIATLQRIARGHPAKGTDFFDLDYIVNNLGGIPSTDLIMKKRDYYDGRGWSAKNFESVLQSISDTNNHRQIISSIKSTLMPDVYFAMEKKFGKEFFEKAASHFEALKPREPTLIFPQ